MICDFLTWLLCSSRGRDRLPVRFYVGAGQGLPGWWRAASSWGCGTHVAHGSSAEKAVGWVGRRSTFRRPGRPTARLLSGGRDTPEFSNPVPLPVRSKPGPYVGPASTQGLRFPRRRRGRRSGGGRHCPAGRGGRDRRAGARDDRGPAGLRAKGHLGWPVGNITRGRRAVKFPDLLQSCAPASPGRPGPRTGHSGRPSPPTQIFRFDGRPPCPPRRPRAAVPARA
jgi:hypothetical protein